MFEPAAPDPVPPTEDSPPFDAAPAELTAPPAVLPTEMWSPDRRIGPVCTLLLAAFPLVSAFAFIFGNHNGFSWNLVAGVSTTMFEQIRTNKRKSAALIAAFVVLLWIGLRSLRHPPSLGLDATGVVIRRGRKATRLAWDEIADVELTITRGEGVTFIFPTIRDSNGKQWKISGLIETPRTAPRARWAVATILATRDQQLELAAQHDSEI